MTDDEKAELAGVYERAADYLEEYGWKQEMWLIPGRPTCFMGAVSMCTDNHSPLYMLAAKVACDALALDGYMPSTVGEWNDDPDRTVDEVVNTLHELANKLR